MRQPPAESGPTVSPTPPQVDRTPTPPNTPRPIPGGGDHRHVHTAETRGTIAVARSSFPGPRAQQSRAVPSLFFLFGIPTGRLDLAYLNREKWYRGPIVCRLCSIAEKGIRDWGLEGSKGEFAGFCILHFPFFILHSVRPDAVDYSRDVAAWAWRQSEISPLMDEPYQLDADGIFVPPSPVAHREEEYATAGFDVLRTMQSRHFWYLGRHRFLLHVLKRHLAHGPRAASRQAIDLGGGCGGWIRYLQDRCPGLFGELALADSSRRALTLAGEVLGPAVPRYQVDLLRLEWNARWDVAFLLDVLEHIPDDVEVLRQVGRALRPGGLLMAAAPALRVFWSGNDVLAGHVRRYARADFVRLAAESGLELCSARYFMFFLSPLLLLRRFASEPATLTPQQRETLLARTHRVPAWPVNQALRLIFSLETPLGTWVPFPWGGSIVAVFRKPGRSAGLVPPQS